MGSRGGKLGISASEFDIKNKLQGNKVDLEYAQMKAHQYGNIKYGGSRKSRERFSMWDDEVKRLQKERTDLEAKLKVISKK